MITLGPDPSAVEASLNSIEFSLREFNTGSFPKGLSVMLSALNQVLEHIDFWCYRPFGFFFSLLH